MYPLFSLGEVRCAVHYFLGLQPLNIRLEDGRIFTVEDDGLRFQVGPLKLGDSAKVFGTRTQNVFVDIRRISFTIRFEGQYCLPLNREP